MTRRQWSCPVFKTAAIRTFVQLFLQS